MKHPEQDLEPKSMRNYSRMKNQVTVSINQPLKFEKKDYGSFYLSGSWSDYWASGQNRSNYSIGYSNSASWGSYSISAQRSWNEDGDVRLGTLVIMGLLSNHLPNWASPLYLIGPFKQEISLAYRK